jgi:hypothetical protein
MSVTQITEAVGRLLTGLLVLVVAASRPFQLRAASSSARWRTSRQEAAAVLPVHHWAVRDRLDGLPPAHPIELVQRASGASGRQ